MASGGLVCRRLTAAQPVTRHEDLDLAAIPPGHVLLGEEPIPDQGRKDALQPLSIEVGVHIEQGAQNPSSPIGRLAIVTKISTIVENLGQLLPEFDRKLYRLVRNRSRRRRWRKGADNTNIVACGNPVAIAEINRP